VVGGFWFLVFGFWFYRNAVTPQSPRLPLWATLGSCDASPTNPNGVAARRNRCRSNSWIDYEVCMRLHRIPKSNDDYVGGRNPVGVDMRGALDPKVAQSGNLGLWGVTALR